MKMAAYLAVALVVLSVIAEAEGSRDRAVRSSAPAEPMRRRGSVTQRGRKKTIWSYNPGHRSLAFLVAGEIEVVSPPPGDAVTGVEYRCLGCCGERTSFWQNHLQPAAIEQSRRLVLRPDGLAVIGTEPNSVNGRCLGCCEDSVTPINGVTTTVTTVWYSPSGYAHPWTPLARPTWPEQNTAANLILMRDGTSAFYWGPRPVERIPAWDRVSGPLTASDPSAASLHTAGKKEPAVCKKSGSTTDTTTTTTKAGGVMKVPITGRQRVWQAPQGAPYENPNWRFESSSSSEEISRVRHPPRRSRFQPIRSRMEVRCRHLGCTSPLGSIVDDSSSSEED